MDKAPDAFRTISEVADVLETPAHVLRFWESRFPQIKPVKRAGGRRYYRPADVALLSGIRQLLHTEGMTIRGVQKVLREQGVRHVAALGGDLGDLDMDSDLDLPVELAPIVDPAPVASPVVVQMTGLTRRASEPPKSAEKPTAAEETFAPTAEVPRDGEGGFIAFSTPRGTKAKPADDPKQASLPFAEAPHVWVEPEPDAPASVTALPEAAAPVAPVTGPVPGPVPADPVLAAQMPETSASALATPMPEADPLPAPDLSGIAARLRRLTPPLPPETAAALTELHSRLGLLHAQMAEAQRLRRPAV